MAQQAEPIATEAGTDDAVTNRFLPVDRWMLLILTLFAIPLAIAVWNDAALTWDGAYYLFRTLDTGQPFIAHDRLIDAPLHWPILWANRLTDSIPVLRAVFGVLHVITPLLSLALSWWVVRRVAPALIIWPIVGIGLATLPGQINFISEGIKAHQLIWPVLLAVLIGLPGRTIPMAGLVSLVIMYLHPAAVPIFAAVAGAALAIAYLRPTDRERLTPFAVSLLIAALLRYGMIGGGYQTGEMNIETMKRQWLNSAMGLPGIALALTFLTALTLLGASRLRTIPLVARLVPPAIVAVAGGALTIWAMDSSLWSDALEFRGPTNIVSLGIAGFAFADAALAHLTRTPTLSSLPRIRQNAGQAIAVAFAVVLSIQSIGYGNVIDDMNDAIAASPEQCIPLGTLPDMPESPLNLWSTPSLSLLYQGWTPEKVVLMDGECERAMQTGALSIGGPGTSYDSTRIDLVPLQWQLGGAGACWWDEPDGWHIAEVTEIGRRRWSDGTGTIRLFVGGPTTVAFTGELISFTQDNTVDIIVNGKRVESVIFGAGQERSLDGISLDLQAGENVIELVSANDAGRAPGDPRDLAFSLLNVEPVLGSDQLCTYRP